MSETRTVRITLHESTWKILDTYMRLLQMKASRTVGALCHPHSEAPIVGGILTYFLRRHGQEIVNAYTEAITRRTREKKKGTLESLDLVTGDNSPAYPVPRTPTHWSSIRKESRGQLSDRSVAAGQKAEKLRAVRGASGG